MIKYKTLKKIITMLLIIVSCLTFLVNLSVEAATDDELSDYFNYIKNFPSYQGNDNAKARWDLLTGKQYKNTNNLDNTPYHTLDDIDKYGIMIETERTALYLLDEYNNTGKKRSEDEIYDLYDDFAAGEIAVPDWDSLLDQYAYIIDSVENVDLNKRISHPREVTPPVNEDNEKDETTKKEENKEEKKKIYTIEDLVFNHIAALDPNVFSDTAGGQPVVDNSAIATVRKAIATWYVSIRNVAIIALFIIIVYIGIRMAIATSASAKANYKGMIINWIIALLIVFTIHFIMVIILNVNDNLVTLLSEGAISEEPLYETIRTRTWDLRISVGFPAAVIYIVLFIFYVKFLWVYIKRLFTILILIVVAPFIGVKYAIESAKTGKKSKAFSGWLYDFIMNVLLQSMHALIYASIMSIAIDLSTKSVIGYIIALVFINFILKADKIFMNIFNFNKSKTASDTSEPMKEPQKQFASAVKAVGSAAVVGGAIGGVATWTGSKVKIIGREVYRTGAKVWDKNHEGNVRKRNKARIDNLHNKYDSAMNKVHRALTGEDSKVRVLSIMSRQKGSLGRAAKKQLKKAKASRKKKYSAPFKFVKSATGNALMIGFGIPAMVVSPKAGFGMITGGIAGNFNMSTAKDDKGNKYEGAEGAAQFFTLGVYGTQKEINKAEKKVDKAVMYIKDIANKEEDIRKSFKDTFGDKETKAAKEYKKDISYILTYAEKDNIYMLLRERLNARDILKIDDNNLDKTVDSMVDDISKEIGLEDQYTDAKVKEIRKKMAEKAKEIYNDTKAYNTGLANQQQASTSSTQSPVSYEPKEFGAEDMAKGFADAIMEEGITPRNNRVDTVEKYKKLTKEIMDLHDTNKNAQKDLKTSVLRETEFIKSLNRKKGSTDSENRFI